MFFQITQSLILSCVVTATAASEAFLQSGSQIVLWRKAAIQSASQPSQGLFWSVCLISQFTRCFIGSYYGHHGDAIRFYGLFGPRAESVINEEKKTHTRENKNSQNTLLLWKGLLSLPPSLPPSLSVSPNAYLPTLCFM